MKAEFSSAGMQQYSWSQDSSSRHSARRRERNCSRDSAFEKDAWHGLLDEWDESPADSRPPLRTELIFSTRPCSTASWMVTRWWLKPMGLPFCLMATRISLKTVSMPRWVEMMAIWPPQVVQGLA